MLGDFDTTKVQIFIQNETFNLIPAYQHREAKLVKSASGLTYSPMNIYRDGIRAEMDPSHANTVSWMINQVNYLLQ